MRLDPHVAPYASYFAAAGAKHGVDPLFLAAICARESGGGIYLSPKGPGGKGDNGHGHGLMQIDDRSHLAWLQAEDWTKPEVNIDMGARVLREALDHFKGQPDADMLAACAYNCGIAAVEHQLAKCPKGDLETRASFVNSRTTGGNYGWDVLGRRARYRLG